MSNRNQTMELISNTAASKIAELEIVKERFIKNYNLSHKSANGELMYHRQLVFFNQQISSNNQLANADKFSLYACFVTAAVNGYSFDPEDNEVYLIPYGGKAQLQRQAGAHIRRLVRTKQIKHAEQAKLVYRGDVFEVENGKVLRHIERFESEDVVAGYVIFVINDEGKERHFVYRKSDWESWRKKSPNPRTVQKTPQQGKPYLSESPWDNGELNGKNPEPNFLRTKLIKHACKEKCWATGTLPAEIEMHQGIEIDADEEAITVEHEDLTPAPIQQSHSNQSEYTSFENVPEPVQGSEHDEDDF